MDFPRFLTSVILHVLLFTCMNLLPSLSQSTNTTTLGNKADRLALLAFKAAVTIDPHGSTASWNSSVHHCQWRGVTCGREGVTGLVLESLGLVGTISPFIGNLSFLKNLHLANNSFHGVIPEEIGKFLSLQDFNLSSNKLSGSIPPSLSQCRNLLGIDLTNNLLVGGIRADIISSLSELLVLNLAMNNLTGVTPGTLGNLSSLRRLDLSSNQLTQVPLASLGHLSSLSYLDLSHNNLAGAVPPSLGNLNALELLDLAHNSLTGEIPPQLRNLSNLLYLDLSYNSIGGNIPPLLGSLALLSHLSLSENNLSGSIPVSLGDRTSLTYLDLSTNSLNGLFPPSFTNLSSLTHLDLSSNELHGPLPEDLGHLTRLKFFNVLENRLSGTIPSSLYNISSLQTLNVVYNSLSGTLPSTIGNTLPNLISLNMFGNNFGGPIPMSLSNASGLTKISLGDNTFRGHVPANLGNLRDLSWLNLGVNRLEATEHTGWEFIGSLTNCTRLQHLFLDHNNLRGELPKSFANLSTQLTWIAIGENKIFGTIPAGIENFVNLNTLTIHKNLFSGSIPDFIGKLWKLEALALFENNFSGTIPSSLGNLTQLNELYLKGNDLQGSIPESLGNCRFLTSLDLSSNHLTGSIPTEVLSLSSLSKYLDLSNNLLSGPLPAGVGRLRSLGQLSISNNRLYGTIPSTLGECEGLEYLRMEHNLFQGAIPASLGTLKGLRVLDLSANNLSGLLPEFLQDLHYLQNLNLSFNELEGEVPRKGVFTNASAVSIYGNDQLCGGIPQLNLPSCPVQASARTEKSHALKVIIPVVVFGVLSLLVLCNLLTVCYWKRKSKTTSSTPHSMDLYWRISYVDLMKATDDFSFDNLIGAGNYGTVYKGVTVDGETVAIKVFHLQRRGAFKSFTAECEALRNIRHRSLVRILTSCSTVDLGGNEFRALVFEFLPNGSLERWLHPESDGKLRTKKRLNLIQRLNIAIDVATALDYLHNQCLTPIIHCDLKPSNVLLDDNMTALVGDFGLARFLPMNINDMSRDPSSSVAIRGSIGYVAPEYGIGDQVSTQGDVYSYGILLLELFTGKRPTNDMFKDGLTLQTYVEEELSKQSKVIEIMDPLLIFGEDDEKIVQCMTDQNKVGSMVEQCMVSVFAVGLSCVKQLPKDRMKIKDVVTHMHAIRDALTLATD